MLAYLTQSPYLLYVTLFILAACYLVNSVGAYSLVRRLSVYLYLVGCSKVRWVRWVISFKVVPLLFSQGETLVPAVAWAWLLFSGTGLGSFDLFRLPTSASDDSPRCSPAALI
jgi:hypothetical protein